MEKLGIISKHSLYCQDGSEFVEKHVCRQVSIFYFHNSAEVGEQGRTIDRTYVFKVMFPSFLKFLSNISLAKI